MEIIPSLKSIKNMTGSYCQVPSIFGVQSDWQEAEWIALFYERLHSKPGGKQWLILHRNEALHKEEYAIHIGTDSIDVEAAEYIGAIWALTTIVQLCSDDQKLPICDINDEPKFSHRGLSLDCVRHFFSVSQVKKIIDEISLIKLNVLHWHLTDDQGWRIESRHFPELTQNCEYYTQKQIEEIVHYAYIRGVEIIPEIDMPGHTTALVSAYPELSCDNRVINPGRKAGIFSNMLCAGNEYTYQFIEELLEEICPLFTSSRMHIGGDETIKTKWKRCPCCQKKMDELHLNSFEDLQGEFSTRISEILRGLHKTPIMWNDCLNTTRLPQEKIVQYWTPMQERTMRRYVRSGGQWIYSNMFQIYFDYPYSMSPVKKIYRALLHPYVGHYKKNEPLGLEAELWCEHIHSNRRMEELLFPRICVLAQLSWSKPLSYNSFMDTLVQNQLKSEQRGVHWTKQDWWNPEGKPRREEAMQHFAIMTSEVDVINEEEEKKAVTPSLRFCLFFLRYFYRLTDIFILLKGKKSVMGRLNGDGNKDT